MSLQIWLPLNGNLNNKGLDKNAIITNNNTTVDDIGKIGKCYAFNGTQKITVKSSKLQNLLSTPTQSFSMSCWIYLDSDETNRVIIFGNYSANPFMNWELAANCTQRLAAGGTSNYTNKTNTTVVPKTTWTHIAVTYDGNLTKFYQNGILSGTTTGANTITSAVGSDTFWLGSDNRTGATMLKGKMNDFRFYDNALSQKEIEEISKGLVCHYKLNDFLYNKVENLMPNSLTMNLGSANASTGTWRNAGTSNMTRSRVAISDTPEGSGYGFQNVGIQTANDGSCYGIDSFPTEPNTFYTISMWARIVSGTEGYAGFNVYNSTDIATNAVKIDKNYRVITLNPNGDWTKCWLTFKTNTATTRNIYIGITTGNTSVTTQMCNVHLEKISYNKNIYDSSGYENNGDLTATSYTNDTPRYNLATQILGTTVDNSSNTKVGAAYIRGFITLTTPSALTVSWWGKNTSYGRGGIFQTTVNADPSECTDYNTTAIANWDSTFRIYNGSTAVNFYNSFLKDNTWHYHTITFDGSIAKYYLDGVQTISSALTGTLPTFKGFCLGLGKAGGVYRQIKQSISDFRIYVTALSETQIKELYNTSMSIDKNGNIYVREVNE